MCAPYVEARPKGGARAEKEIGEKAQKIIRYQIVSTYFLHGAFKVFTIRGLIKDTFFVRVLCVYGLCIDTQIRNQADGILGSPEKIIFTKFIFSPGEMIMHHVLFFYDYLLYVLRVWFVYRTQKSKMNLLSYVLLRKLF
jgi:hypothetical protein